MIVFVDSEGVFASSNMAEVRSDESDVEGATKSLTRLSIHPNGELSTAQGLLVVCVELYFVNKK